MEIKKQTNLRGELTVPGDKSISHRAVRFSCTGYYKDHTFS